MVIKFFGRVVVHHALNLLIIALFIYLFSFYVLLLTFTKSLNAHHIKYPMPKKVSELQERVNQLKINDAHKNIF